RAVQKGSCSAGLLLGKERNGRSARGSGHEHDARLPGSSVTMCVVFLLLTPAPLSASSSTPLGYRLPPSTLGPVCLSYSAFFFLGSRLDDATLGTKVAAQLTIRPQTAQRGGQP